MRNSRPRGTRLQVSRYPKEAKAQGSIAPPFCGGEPSSADDGGEWIACRVDTQKPKWTSAIGRFSVRKWVNATLWRSAPKASPAARENEIRRPVPRPKFVEVEVHQRHVGYAGWKHPKTRDRGIKAAKGQKPHERCRNVKGSGGAAKAASSG